MSPLNSNYTLFFLFLFFLLGGEGEERSRRRGGGESMLYNFVVITNLQVSAFLLCLIHVSALESSTGPDIW